MLSGASVRALLRVPMAVSRNIAALHTSAPLLESKRKRTSRLRRQANLAQRDIRQRLFDMSKPDPVLAHQLNDEGYALWSNSELAKLILSKEEVCLLYTSDAADE